jgi:outer membrane biosynthesis protein TonB
MDPTVVAVLAAVALLVALGAYAKANAAERRAREVEERADKLERARKAPAPREALPPPADEDEEPPSEPEPEPKPESDRESSPSPSPAEPEAEPAVVARAEEMFRDAHAIARQAGFDYLEKVGEIEGYRVSVEQDSQLDREAVAYLLAHEERVLEVRRDEGKTYLIVHA